MCGFSSFLQAAHPSETPLPNAAIVDLIAAQLPDLTHPGDGSGAIKLPMASFRTAGIPPEMAEQFAAKAGYPSADITRLIAEAIVHLIETQGASEIIGTAELSRLRRAEAAAEPKRHRQVQVACHCGTPLFTATIADFDSDHAKVAGSELIKAMRTFGSECATGHRLS